MKWLPARPTVYRGIRMRSRLEADFARWLDSVKAVVGVTWDYEPECFADETGQYLPDFRINWPGETPEYIEVKPDGLGDDFDTDAVLAQMGIIWSSQPEANLCLMFWRQHARRAPFLVFGLGETREWWSRGEGEEDYHYWPGMGQFEALVREAQAAQAQSGTQ